MPTAGPIAGELTVHHWAVQSSVAQAHCSECGLLVSVGTGVPEGATVLRWALAVLDSIECDKVHWRLPALLPSL